jgi:hypothetical protein
MGGVSNVDIDGNNTLQVKVIGVTIYTFETLPTFETPPDFASCPLPYLEERLQHHQTGMQHLCKSAIS